MPLRLLRGVTGPLEGTINVSGIGPSMESLPIGAPASLAGTLAAVATAAARPLLVLGVVVAFFTVPALKKLWKEETCGCGELR